MFLNVTRDINFEIKMLVIQVFKATNSKINLSNVGRIWQINTFHAIR